MRPCALLVSLLMLFMIGCAVAATPEAATHEPTPTNAPTPVGVAPQQPCSPAYPTVCIPPPPPYMDCGEIAHQGFVVLRPDPHGLDRDRDGIGCESRNPSPTATRANPPTAAPTIQRSIPPAATRVPRSIEQAPTRVSRSCCKYCSKGKACGNSCISRSYTCHQPAGCACNR